MSPSLPPSVPSKKVGSNNGTGKNGTGKSGTGKNDTGKHGTSEKIRKKGTRDFHQFCGQIDSLAFLPVDVQRECSYSRQDVLMIQLPCYSTLTKCMFLVNLFREEDKTSSQTFQQ